MTARGNTVDSMQPRLIEAWDLPQAWFFAIKAIFETGVSFKVESGSEITDTKKIAMVLSIAHPENRPLLHEQAPCDLSYIENTYLDYLFEDTKTKEESYTYGQRLRKPVDQIQKVIDRYKTVKGTRQNTIVVRIPQDMDEPEPPCLTIIDTEVLDGRLIFYPYFRSWDCFAGLPANLAGLQYLKEYMALEIGVTPGPTVAMSKNLHLYQRQFGHVEQVIYR